MLFTSQITLPIADQKPVERADAARNRRRILAAAEKLFEENGVSCTSMDAIAAEACVGKGTLFRRFGDRASLALAVLDETERLLQEAMLHGPPPLGPGAEPTERLIAFGEAVIDHVELHTDLSLEAEIAKGGYLRSQPYGVRWLHVRSLVRQARPDADAEYVADVLLMALAAPLLAHQRRTQEMEPKHLKAGFRDLAERLLG